MTPHIAGRQPSALADGRASSLSPPIAELPRLQRRDANEKVAMPDVPDDCWSRVKNRLRAELGEAIYTSWFARMELESLDLETAHISVPTRFLKSWIQSHYSERLLACWQAERSTLRRIDLLVRSAVLRGSTPCAAAQAEAAPAEKRDPATSRTDVRIPVTPGAPIYDPRGGSPLDPRLTFETFVVGRSNTLAHAAAKQVAMG